VVVVSTEGGVDIEAVAEKSPDKIYRERLHPLIGMQPFTALKLARYLEFSGDQLKAAAKLIMNVYRLFSSLDCSLVEINPLALTKNNEVLALDAKFNFDDNALYRHPEIVAMRDENEEDPREVEASKFSLNYIGLDGDIACLVNGAGLAMARQLSRRRRRRQRRAGNRGFQNPGFRQERESDPGEYLRRDHALRCDRSRDH
jgi:succinyl-CoA synthetase beta subunit